MGGAEEPPEIKQRRTVYERPSCKESVFGKMLAIKTIALCSHYLQHIKAVVNTVGGLLASRRVYCRLPLFFFCSYSTNSDESTSLNTRKKQQFASIAALYQ